MSGSEPRPARHPWARATAVGFLLLALCGAWNTVRLAWLDADTLWAALLPAFRTQMAPILFAEKGQPPTPTEVDARLERERPRLERELEGPRRFATWMRGLLAALFAGCAGLLAFAPPALAHHGARYAGVCALLPPWFVGRELLRNGFTVFTGWPGVIGAAVAVPVAIAALTIGWGRRPAPTPPAP